MEYLCIISGICSLSLGKPRSEAGVSCSGPVEHVFGYFYFFKALESKPGINENIKCDASEQRNHKR